MTAAERLEAAANHLREGRTAEAASICREILALEPDHAEASYLLGVVLFHTGYAGEAVPFIRRAVELRPDIGHYRVAFGAALGTLGRQNDAIVELREATRLDPHSPEAWDNLATAMREVSQFPQAMEAHRRAAELRPHDATLLNKLASALMEVQRWNEAAEMFRRILSIQPDFYPAMHNLAVVLRRQGNLEEAIAILGRAIAIQPNLADLHNHLGSALLEAHRNEQAIASFSRAVQLHPDFADAHFNLGNSLQTIERYDDAIASYRKAVALRPQFKEAIHNLGNALKDSGRVEEAIACYRQSITLGLTSFEVHANLGAALRTAGDLDAAIESLRRAAELNPCSAAAQNLLYTIHLHPDYGPERIREEHAKWNTACARPISRFIRPYDNDCDPDRRLRIGYVSPDFRRHPVGTLILPVLARHDHEQVEVFCYSNVLKPDPLTAQTRQYADVWRDCTTLSDEQLAELIRSDRIDILIDLALHTEDSRLLTFARKPAPIQATWLGYPSTTGLDAMDYRFSDPHLDPPHEDRSAFYSEKTILLDSFWCYDPAVQISLADRPPFQTNGFITFGCFNNSAKITDVTLSLWASVMRTVEGSHLQLLVPPVARARLLSKMQSLGIDPSRIQCMVRLNRDQYFEAYNRIDICLDTFPYTGHTTTLDAVWMGCPVVTLTAQTAVSRGSASILSNAGAPDLVATTPQQLVQIIGTLATDPARLKAIRPSLRQGMENSVIKDAPGFTRRLEQTYRGLWKSFCDG